MGGACDVIVDEVGGACDEVAFVVDLGCVWELKGLI